MRKQNRLCPAVAFALATISVSAAADPLWTAAAIEAPQHAALVIGVKAISTQTLGARSTVTPTATSFGGFEIRADADVYILVRGNSLGTLNVTQGFLDAPRARLYDSQAHDIVIDSSSRAGFNGCVSGSVFTDPVVSYYQNVRGQPAHARDACVALHLVAGVYTFSVTPSLSGVTTTTGTSSPSSGEILFEVTLNP